MIEVLSVSICVENSKAETFGRLAVNWSMVSLGMMPVRLMPSSAVSS